MNKSSVFRRDHPTFGKMGHFPPHLCHPPYIKKIPLLIPIWNQSLTWQQRRIWFWLLWGCVWVFQPSRESASYWGTLDFEFGRRELLLSTLIVGAACSSLNSDFREAVNVKRGYSLVYFFPSWGLKPPSGEWWRILERSMSCSEEHRSSWISFQQAAFYWPPAQLPS